MTVKEICNHIWDLEEKYDLLDQQIEGVYFWKIIRFLLFLRITKKLGIYGQAHSPKKSIFSRLKILPISMWNSYLHGSLTRKETKEILVFQHPRKKLVEGKYIDIYTHYLIRQLQKESKSYEIIDIMHQYKHYRKASNTRSYDDHFYISSLFKRLFKRVKLDAQSEKLLKSIEGDINNTFNINIPLTDITKQRIKIFWYTYQYYKKLIRKRKPSKVYLVVSYGLEPLIAACRENGVETVELQHGVINLYHLGYSYPNNQWVPYFPDKMFLFSRYWYDNTPLPIPKEQTQVYGFPHLAEMHRKYSDIPTKSKSVIFISQGTIGSELSRIAYLLAEENRDFSVIFKLHPGEYDRWRDEYPDLIRAQRLSNFSVVDNSNINLHRYLAESEYLVGVYSTVVYEGLMFNCKTILMNLPGIDYMEYLIKNNYARLADDQDDIIKLIEENEFSQLNREEIFGI
jgi:hypothetical protein